MIEPLHFSFEIACSQDRAFQLWTSRASTWWPAGHSVSGASDLEVVFEAHVGGRVYERTPAGDEHDWGSVTRWEPPTALGYTWHLRADRADATDVEIRFLPAARGGTRVEIEHRGWERLGTRSDERREGNRHGWEAVLPHFIDSAKEGAG